MLKFLYTARIFNFSTFMTNFSLYFKHVVLFYLDKLLGLSYMVGNIEISSLYPNLNHNTIPPIVADMFQTVRERLV
jgi:hypothetical protein